MMGQEFVALKDGFDLWIYSQAKGRLGIPFPWEPRGYAGPDVGHGIALLPLTWEYREGEARDFVGWN